MNVLSAEYVIVINQILLSNPKDHPTDLMVEIDEIQHKVDIEKAPQLFVEGWNSACTDPAMTIKDVDKTIKDCIYKWKYFWCFGPLLQACRYTVADTIRQTFDEPTPVKPYVPDAVLFRFAVAFVYVLVCCVCI